MKKLLFFLLFSTAALAEDYFGGAGMIFAKPTTQPVQSEQPVTPAEKKPSPKEKCETCSNSSLGEKSMAELSATAFEGEYETENGEIKEVVRTKPNFLKREIMNNPMYGKKWYVKRYYNSMKVLNDALDAKEAEALREAAYLGDAHERQVRERLRIERPFLFKWDISEEDLEKKLSENPQNVMYQILSRVQYYPNSAEMTDENRQNIRKELEKSFQSQSGLSVEEFEKLKKEQKLSDEKTSPIKGENLFESSVYFQ